MIIKNSSNQKDYFKFGLVVALGILKKDGKISVEQIRAIPLIEEEDVARIISVIRKLFYIEIITEKVSSEPYLEWNRVIRLK